MSNGPVELHPYRSGQDMGDVVDMNDFRPRPVKVQPPTAQGSPADVAAAVSQHPSNPARFEQPDGLPGPHESDDVPLRALALDETGEDSDDLAEGNVEPAESDDDDTLGDFSADVPSL